MQVNVKVMSSSRNFDVGVSVVISAPSYHMGVQHLSFDVQNKNRVSSNLASPQNNSNGPIGMSEQLIDQDQEVSHNFVLRLGSPSVVSYEMVGTGKQGFVGDYTSFSKQPNLKQNAQLNLKKMRERMNFAGTEGVTPGCSSAAYIN